MLFIYTHTHMSACVYVFKYPAQEKIYPAYTTEPSVSVLVSILILITYTTNVERILFLLSV